MFASRVEIEDFELFIHDPDVLALPQTLNAALHGVDIQADRPFKQVVTLEDIKQAKALASMMLVKKGARLSVQPVTPEQWRHILSMGGLK